MTNLNVAKMLGKDDCRRDQMQKNIGKGAVKGADGGNIIYK